MHTKAHRLHDLETRASRHTYQTLLSSTCTLSTMNIGAKAAKSLSVAKIYTLI